MTSIFVYSIIFYRGATRCKQSAYALGSSGGSTEELLLLKFMSNRVKIEPLWDESFEILLDGEVVGTAKTQTEATMKELIVKQSIGESLYEVKEAK